VRNLKKFFIAMLFFAIVLLSATFAVAGSPAVFTHTYSYNVNTAPTGFSCTNTCVVPSKSTPGDCAVTCTWTPITLSSSDGDVEGYVLEVKAHYVSSPGLTCPADTVLSQTISVPASSSDCTTTSCTGTIDLIDSVGLTGYEVTSFGATVKGIIRTYMRGSSWASVSLPNDAAATFTAAPNPCPTTTP